MLGDRPFPADRWYRVGATDAEVEFLSDWHDTIEMANAGQALISSASYSDWDLTQQLDAWRAQGVLPVPGQADTEDTEAPPPPAKRAAAKA